MRAATGFPETGTFSSKVASRNSRFPAPLPSFACRTGTPLQKVSAFCYLKSESCSRHVFWTGFKLLILQQPVPIPVAKQATANNGRKTSSGTNVWTVFVQTCHGRVVHAAHPPPSQHPRGLPGRWPPSHWQRAGGSYL